MRRFGEVKQMVMANTEDQTERWKDHFEGVLNRHPLMLYHIATSQSRNRRRIKRRKNHKAVRIGKNAIGSGFVSIEWKEENIIKLPNKNEPHSVLNLTRFHSAKHSQQSTVHLTL